MTSTSKGMSAQDIALIIMTCHQAGVKELHLDKLRILFGASNSLGDQDLTKHEQNINNSTRNVPSDTPFQSESVELDEEDRLVHLMLTDSVAFEEAVKSQGMNE